MKVAMISYHSNLFSLYPESWISEYRESVLEQTFSDFDVFEVNYGGDFGFIFWRSQFQSRKFDNFVYCMNYLLDYLFNELEYDYVLNSNVDDVYERTWIEKTLSAIQRGYELVSCNFKLFDNNGVYHTHYFDRLNIKKELLKNHNIICHPGVCYSRGFWLRGNRYNPHEVPYEDLKLWQRSIDNSKFFIQPEHLVLHRVHKDSVCQKAAKI